MTFKVFRADDRRGELDDVAAAFYCGSGNPCCQLHHACVDPADIGIAFSVLYSMKMRCAG